MRKAGEEGSSVRSQIIVQVPRVGLGPRAVTETSLPMSRPSVLSMSCGACLSVMEEEAMAG